MAWKIGSNTVINTSGATVPYSTITSKPSGLVETVSISGSTGFYKVSFSGSTLTFTKA